MHTMNRFLVILFLGLLILSGCNENSTKSTNTSTIQVKNTSQTETIKKPAEIETSKTTETTTLNSSNNKFVSLGAKSMFYEGSPSISIIFSQPIDGTQNFSKYISLNDNSGTKLNLKGILDESRQLVIFKGLQPDTKYSVSVNSGLESAKGTKLEKSTTSEYLKTLKLTRAASFLSPGSIITPHGEKSLAISITDANSINVDFFYLGTDFKDAKNAEYLLEAGSSAGASHGLSASDMSNNEQDDDSPSHASALKTPFISKPYNITSKDSQTVAQLPLPAEITNKPGLYFAVVQLPGEFKTFATTYFYISDINLNVRKYSLGNFLKFDIQATSFETGKPLEGTTVQIVAYNGTLLGTEKTASNGTISLTTPTSAYTLYAANNEHFATLSLNTPLDLSAIIDYSAGYVGKHTPQKMFIYGPRNIYRSGETIKWNILIRSDDGELILSGPITLSLRNPDNKLIQNITALPDKNLGFIEYSFKLPETSMTGSWSFSAQSNDQNIEQINFKVEDFMPERLKLTLGVSNMPEVMSAQEAQKLNILCEYLYGAPAAGNDYKIEASASINNLLFDTPDMWENYIFAEEKTHDQEITSFTDSLDENGKATFSIPLEKISNWQTTSSPITLKYKVFVTESGGRVIQRMKTQTYLPKGTALGIKDNNIQNPSDTNAHFKMINIDDKGSIVPTSVNLILQKEERSYYWEKATDGYWEQKYSSVFYPVESQTITIKNQPVDLNLPVSLGYYKIILINEKNNQTLAYSFESGTDWLTGSDYSSATRPDKLTLSLDKLAYNIGDKATVTIVAPYLGNGTIVVEDSEGTRWSEPLKLNNKNTTVVIPIADDWNRHDLYISAYIARPENTLQKLEKSHSFGILHLPLNRENRHLNLSIEAPTKIRPNQNITVSLKINGTIPQGPIAVTVAAVDRGILSLSPYPMPNAWKKFFSKEAYGVEIFDNFWQVMHKYTDKKVNTFGGDGALEAGGTQAKAHIQIVSIFNKPVTFDEKGEASITLNIPNFNGELRLDALAFSANSFGAAETSMKVADPIVAELSMPRFVATGDKTNLVLDLQNMENTTQNFTVDVKIGGSLILTNSSLKHSNVQLEIGKKKTIKLPINVDSRNKLSNIEINLSNVMYHGTPVNISRHWKLQARNANPVDTVSSLEELNPSKKLTISTASLEKYYLDSAQVRLSIDALPPLGLNEHLKYLLQYPYGCIEQTTSKGLALLLATPAVQSRFNMTMQFEHPEDNRNDLIQRAINLIFDKQNNAGGFGFWDANSEEQSWGTVYATDFLLMAKNAGFNVDKIKLEKSLLRLVTYVRSGTSSSNRYYSDSLNAELSTRIYAAYVLSKIKAAPLADTRNLLDQYENSITTKLPALQLSIALKNMGDVVRAQKAYDLALNKPLPKNSDYFGDYGSNIRDLALCVPLFNQYSKNSLDARNGLLELSKLMRTRQYLSTQERISLLRVALNVTDETPWSGTILVNNETISLNRKGLYSATWKGKHLQNGIVFTSTANKNIYVKIDIVAYPKKLQQTKFTGVDIKRFYYTEKGEPTSLDNIQSGDLILVRLDYAANRSSQNLLLVDLLPAGFELENQNLDNTIKIANLDLPDELKNIIQNSDWLTHSEYRDDRFIGAVTYSHSGQVFYLMRATTPGTYINPPAQIEDMYQPEIRGLIIPQPRTITIYPINKTSNI